MSTLAQEEADRFFSQSEHHTSHPEDRIGHDGTSLQSSSSSSQKNPADYYARPERDNDDDDDDDEDTLHSMTTATTTATYRVPTTHFSANTGPKGVISDAQSFTQAKKSTFRSTLTAFSNGAHSSFSYGSQRRKASNWNRKNSIGDNSDNELGASDEEDFMRQWREKRLMELAASGSAAQRRQSPSKRVWGTFDDVDANGYLDAVEKVPDDAIVVVCIYDPLSNASAAVEDSLSSLARKYVTTRFVKLNHEIAEMEHIDVPAILAYKAGEVFATLSDCRPDDLETSLRRNDVLC